MKKSDQLDQLIRNKLNQLHVEYDPATWDMLEHKLDATDAGVPQAEDTWLDEVVFEKVHKLEAVDRASSWEKLAARLDEETHIHREALRTRVMEVALVLLILFTFVQYFGEQTPVRFFEKALNAYNNNIENKVANHVKENSENLAHQSPTNKATTAKNASSNTQIAMVAPGLSDSKYDKNLKTSALSEDDVKKYKPSPKLPGAPSKPYQSASNIAIQNPAQQAPATDLPIRRAELLAALEQISVTELTPEENEDYPYLVKPLQPKGGMSVMMFGSMDYNKIITPPVLEEGGEVTYKGFERYALGYSGGIMASWEKGLFEIGAGAIYTAKSYEPRPLVYLNGSLKDGYYGESFKLVELNMLQLPLQIRYNFMKKNRWRAFVTGGLSLQVALQANYYLGDEEDLVGSNPLPRQQPKQGTVTIAESKKNILSKGWLEGGTLWENGYVTGNVGIGLEYFMTERLGIFVQPTYQKSLDYFTKGFGPDQDRINTMSIFTGVRVKL